MKHLLITLLFSFIVPTAFSQVVTIEYILALPKQTVEKYNVESTGNNSIVLKMDFAKSSLKNRTLIDSIKKYKIRRIDLVFSHFRSSEKFHQEKLNRERLKQLYNLYPTLFDNNLIEWNLIEQKAGNTKEEASELFHGFVFHLAPKKMIREKNGTVREMTTEDEIAFIKHCLLELSSVKEERIPSINCRDSIFETTDTTGRYLPRSPKKMGKGIRYKSPSIWKRSKEIVHGKDTITKCDTSYTRPYVYPSSGAMLGDTVVLKYFHAQKNTPSPGKTVVVEDVTGSMNPYIAQTLLWRRRNIRNYNRFVFFNDGDNKPDELKIIGNTGGLHTVESPDIDEVESMAYLAMMQGNGGDGPENNIEASLFALKTFPDCDTLIMIADNQAPVKDITLLPSLKKPVKVIVCGVYYNILIDYIMIAQKTHGSVHTMEQDIYNLSDLKNNSEVKIGGQTFLFKDGKFTLLR